jgi:CRP-like cAMP-binding protein
MTSQPLEKVKTFFSKYPVHTFDKRQLLASAGEPLPGIFYVVEGRVSSYDITPAGNEVVVNVYKPGAFFPMSSALNDIPNGYFLEASTKVKAHIAPMKDVVEFMQANPDVTFDLLSRVYRGVEGVLRRMAYLMGGDTKSRLLFELLNAAYRFGESKDDDSVFIPLSENDIARHSGMARETVNRNLQHIKSEGLVQVSHSGITIKDLPALEKKLNEL